MNWEITTFIAYFVILLGVALVFYFNGTNKNSEDFFLGGRSMGPWVTALSAQASDMSAWLLMGLPGSILAFGFGQMWIGIGLATAKATDAIARQPEAADKIQRSLLIGCALAEATAIYGLVIGIMIILFVK